MYPVLNRDDGAPKISTTSPGPQPESPIPQRLAETDPVTVFNRLTRGGVSSESPDTA